MVSVTKLFSQKRKAAGLRQLLPFTKACLEGSDYG